MHIKITSTQKAGPPEQWGRYLFLTYQAPLGVLPPRYVAAVFREDSGNRRHIFSVNRDKVYYLFYSLPEKHASPGSTVEYRINVDGVWVTDPHIGQNMEDEQGVVFSVFPIPQYQLLAPTRSPVVNADGSVRFSYRSRPGSTVYFVSTLNDWDPFMHRMDEDLNEPGLYQIRFPLQNMRGRIGTVYYYFLEGVEKTLDPLNPEIGMDDNGQQVNVFVYRPAEISGFRRRGN